MVDLIGVIDISMWHLVLQIDHLHQTRFECLYGVGAEKETCEYKMNKIKFN